MTAAVSLGGGLRDFTAINIRTAVGAGGRKIASQALIRTAEGLKVWYSNFAVALSAAFALGRGNSAAPTTVTSNAITATATGAVGTITYAWTRTDGDPQPWTIDSPNAQATTFSTVADQGESFNATFICTLTDQAGQTLASGPVTANCANIYYGGGYAGGGGGPYP